MESIPEGYKKTKVGIIPLGWEKLELKEFIDISAKKFNPKTSQEGKKCIELEHLSQKTGQLLGYINSKEQQSAKNVFNKGQILYGKLRPYLQKYWKAEFDGVCSTEIWVLSGKKMINEYLFYLVQTNKFNQIANVSSGSKMPRADWKYMAEIPFNIPPLKEQQKIAKILTTWDDAISCHVELIKAKEQLKKGLMQKLLSGEVRFDGFSDKWQFIKLGNLLDYEQPTNYLVANKDYDDSYKTPVLTAGKTFILGYTKEENGIFKNDLPVIIFDDFTTATKFVDFPFKAKSSAMKILKAKNRDVNVKLVFEMMQMINYSAEDHKRYWISEYQELEIKLPSPQEQQKIAQVLSTADKEIELLKNELESLKEQKKGLMQKLLTGEVRVKI